MSLSNRLLNHGMQDSNGDLSTEMLCPTCKAKMQLSGDSFKCDRCRTTIPLAIDEAGSHNTVWNMQDDALLRRMFAKSISVEEIAEIMDRSKSSIVRRLYDLGALANVSSHTSFSKKLTGDPYALIRKKYPKAYTKWEEREEFRLIHLLNNGLDVDHIASELGRQPSAIRSRIRKLIVSGDLSNKWAYLVD